MKGWRKKNWAPACAGVTMLALVACSVDPAPPQRFYRVEVAPAQPASAFHGRIVVEPFEAYGIYNERPLVFVSGSATGALEQYHYQFWAEPPGVMLRDALIAYLRSTFPSAQVEQAGGRAHGDFTVRARLKRFEHVAGSAPQASLAVEFRVTDARDDERALTSFDEKAVANGASIEDFVAAMDLIAGKAYAQLVTELRKALGGGNDQTGNPGG